MTIEIWNKHFNGEASNSELRSIYTSQLEKCWRK